MFPTLVLLLLTITTTVTFGTANNAYTTKLEQKLDSYLAIRSSKLYGGLNAAPFDDKLSWQYDAITAIRLECSGDLMYSIQMKYGDTWATKHGADRSCANLSCTSHTKTLAEDERITSVKMVIFNTSNIDFIHATTFNTNKGELITCGDVHPHPGRTIEVSRGHQLQYINGRSGDAVASLQFHWSQQRADECLAPVCHTKLYGGLNAAPFDDKTSWQNRKITAIRLECSGDLMYSIQMKYGDTWATKHGADRSCANFSCISYTKTLAEDERITSVKMIIFKTSNIDFIHATTFNTNKRELITCGDVHPHPGRTIEVSRGHQLQYINGRSGDAVASLQFHWSENLSDLCVAKHNPSEK